jgi:hypothetical protein
MHHRQAERASQFYSLNNVSNDFSQSQTRYIGRSKDCQKAARR